jgi:hypothetical protein
VQGILLIADHNGVTGVVAAVELDDPVGAFTEQIGGFALTFVAPLHSDDHDAWHDEFPRGDELVGLESIGASRPGPRRLSRSRWIS